MFASLVFIILSSTVFRPCTQSLTLHWYVLEFITVIYTVVRRNYFDVLSAFLTIPYENLVTSVAGLIGFFVRGALHTFFASFKAGTSYFILAFHARLPSILLVILNA